jgi:hypothetical protein
LVKVHDTLGDGEVVWVRDLVVVEQVENETKDLISSAGLIFLNVRYAYLISKTTLLHDVHADVQNIVH